MEILLQYVPYFAVLLVVIVGTIALVSNEKKNIQEWLLLAVIEAEKALGGGTGKLKLRQVYENFVKIYPIFSKFVRFETFSLWVDLALNEMKKLLVSNKSAENYVKGIE